MLEKVQEKISGLLLRLEQLRGYLDLGSKLKRLGELDALMSGSGFWDDQEAARTVIDEANALKRWTEPLEKLGGRLADLGELCELAGLDEEDGLSAELLSDAEAIEKELAGLETLQMLSGNDDQRDAILTIHPGAGGTESQDWAQMLARMYSRWIEAHSFKSSVMDLQPGDEAGIKSITMEVQGQFAYGYLKAEKGVHRLVRISPFDANKRRHTSFASVFVYPQASGEIEVQIEEKDLRIDTFRASGAGGQHVNKTDSAVRITHLPTGIVVQCQNERSQHRNKNNALKILSARLYEQKQEEERAERQAMDAEKKEIAWGSQIRSYVLQPYTLVKDHRTGFERGDASAVLEGGLDGFIEAYLKQSGKPGA
ncbi:MAG: peptide chain release factor 2 [Gemmatimonadota bacterium]|nr:peptide chain release factor 2 [Gemmatimonadota bacterium]